MSASHSSSARSRRSPHSGSRVQDPRLAALAGRLLKEGFAGEKTAMIDAASWSRRTVNRLLKGERKPSPETQKCLVELSPLLQGELPAVVDKAHVARRFRELLAEQGGRFLKSSKEFLTEAELCARTRALGEGSVVVVVGAPLYRPLRGGQRARHAQRLAATVTAGQTVLFLHAHQARLRPEQHRERESGYLQKLEDGLKEHLSPGARGFHATFDSGDALTGPVTSPFVLTLRPVGERGMRAESLYQKVPSQGSGYMWVRLDDERMTWFSRQLRRSVVPLRNPRFLSPVPTIQRRYNGYDQSAHEAIARMKGEGYRRDPLLPQSVVDALTERCEHRIRVLEVGGRNLRESFDLFYRPLVVQEGLPVQTLVLEPQFERFAVDPLADQRLQGIRGVYAPATLEDFHPREGARFDLVLVNHRLYFSDPSVLGKLVMLLQPGGFLVVLHSPLEGNVFSAISELTQDALRPGAESATIRSYSEDLQDWFRLHMREVTPRRIKHRIPMDRMLRDGRVTPDLEEAVRHLTLDATLPAETRRSMLAMVQRHLVRAKDQGMVDASEHLFVVERPMAVEWEHLLPQRLGLRAPD